MELQISQGEIEATLRKHGLLDLLYMPDMRDLVPSIAKMEKMGEMLDTIVENAAEVDASIETFKSSMTNVAGTMFEASGDMLLQSKDYGKYQNEAAAIGLAGMAVSGLVSIAGDAIGWVRKKWNEHKRDEQRREILRKKEALARAKMGTVEDIQQSASRMLPRLSQMYEREFANKVRLDSEIRDRRVKMFRKVMYVYGRAQFTCSLAEYFKHKFSAWIDWKEYEAMPPLQQNVYADMVSQWMNQNRLPSLLRDKDAEWPVNLLLSLQEPLTMRLAWGYNNGCSGSSNPALLRSSGFLCGVWPSSQVRKMIKSNPYYQTMRTMDRKKPTWILLLDILLVGLVGWGAYSLFMSEHGFWATVCAIAGCVGVGYIFYLYMEKYEEWKRKVEFINNSVSFENE